VFEGSRESARGAVCTAANTAVTTGVMSARACQTDRAGLCLVVPAGPYARCQCPCPATGTVRTPVAPPHRAW
jgi:hypothetical protein